MKPINIIYLMFISVLLMVVACNKDDEPKDVTPPQITIYGNQTVTIPLFGNWRNEVPSPQAVAEDSNDGPLDFEVQSEVDSTKAGLYDVIYRASDNAGNVASETRTVVVRIEGTNLEGIWQVLGDAGGITINFVDTLVDPQQNEFYFARFSDYFNARVQAELSGQMGDSVNIPEQTLMCGDPPKSRTFSGSGKVISDGKSMEVRFSETTEGETLQGEINYYLEDK